MVSLLWQTGSQSAELVVCSPSCLLIVYLYVNNEQLIRVQPLCTYWICRKRPTVCSTSWFVKGSSPFHSNHSDISNKLVLKKVFRQTSDNNHVFRFQGVFFKWRPGTGNVFRKQRLKSWIYTLKTLIFSKRFRYSHTFRFSGSDTLNFIIIIVSNY